MITIQENDSVLDVTVIGELTLADYQEFEEQMPHKSHAENKTNAVFDLRGMLDYTIDVA